MSCSSSALRLWLSSRSALRSGAWCVYCVGCVKGVGGFGLCDTVRWSVEAGASVKGKFVDFTFPVEIVSSQQSIAIDQPHDEYKNRPAGLQPPESPRITMSMK